MIVDAVAQIRTGNERREALFPAQLLLLPDVQSSQDISYFSHRWNRGTILQVTLTPGTSEVSFTVSCETNLVVVGRLVSIESFSKHGQWPIGKGQSKVEHECKTDEGGMEQKALRSCESRPGYVYGESDEPVTV